ncbi:carbonic anhydrase [Bacteroidales bacterium AH-315-N07]|nr:carbonic anhydrase [Bacteroidales bacterium AH-315-N07]
METKTLTRKERDNLSPSDVLMRLKLGNFRFLGTKEKIVRNYRKQIEETASGQFPCAVVLGCIDSRVPAELIFDQGIGDIFNIRVAGNVLNDDVIGSMEFACKVSGVKLIVVLGHTRCGAVKGACEDTQLGKLTGLLDKIKPAVEAIREQNSYNGKSDNSDFLKAVTKQNVVHVMEAIQKESEVLQTMARKGLIEIVGAMYYVENGKVEFDSNSI